MSRAAKERIGWVVALAAALITTLAPAAHASLPRSVDDPALRAAIAAEHSAAASAVPAYRLLARASTGYGLLPREPACVSPSTYPETRVRASGFLAEAQRQGTRQLSLDLAMGVYDGPSMYQFAGYDPVNNGDPLGLCFGKLGGTRFCQAISEAMTELIFGDPVKRAEEESATYKMRRAFEKKVGRFPEDDELIYSSVEEQVMVYGDGRVVPMEGIESAHHELLFLAVGSAAWRSAALQRAAGASVARQIGAAGVSAADEVAGEVLWVNPSSLGRGVPRAALRTPQVSSTKLQNIVNDLYKGTTNPGRVGTGTTADALRFEMSTGERVFGKSHLQKAEDSLRGLENWLKANPTAPYSDRLVARSLADDLLDALGRSR